jgi:hypothetical protein
VNRGEERERSPGQEETAGYPVARRFGHRIHDRSPPIAHLNALRARDADGEPAAPALALIPLIP